MAVSAGVVGSAAAAVRVARVEVKAEEALVAPVALAVLGAVAGLAAAEERPAGSAAALRSLEGRPVAAPAVHLAEMEVWRPLQSILSRKTAEPDRARLARHCVQTV